MKKASLGIIAALLTVGIGINLWQGGKANLLTWLGYVPLLGYLILCLFSWWLAPKR